MKYGAIFAAFIYLFPMVTQAACIETSSKCVVEQKSADGSNLCMKRQLEFSCDNGSPEVQVKTACTPLREQGCIETSAECSLEDSNGRCLKMARKFDCPTQPLATEAQDCKTSLFCQDGNCFDTSYEPNKDMALAVTYMEAAREVAAYMNTEGKVFKGKSFSCREGWAGVRDCCGSESMRVAQDISDQLLMGAMSAAVWTGAQMAWDYASGMVSGYMYNAITGTWVSAFASYLGIQTAAAGTEAAATAAAGVTTFSVAGFGIGFGTAAGAQAGATVGTSLIGTNTAISGSMSAFGTNIQFFFNPAMFAIFVAIAIYTALSSCKEKEIMLKIYRGSGSCQYVPAANYCSKEINLGFKEICIETTYMYCCYNSPLARILNHATKGQLKIRAAYGKGRPNCDPIKITDLEKIDFKKIDFRDFFKHIAPGGKGTDFWKKKLAEYNDISTEYDTQEITQLSDSEAEMITTSSHNEFWTDRAMMRIDVAAEENRADVERPSEGSYTTSNKPYYDSSDESSGY